MNLRDLTGWFNSTLAGRFVVTADTRLSSASASSLSLKRGYKLRMVGVGFLSTR